MKFEAMVSDNRISVEKQSDGTFDIDGKKREVSVEILEPGIYSLIVDGQCHEVSVRDEKKGFLVEVNSHIVPVKLVDPFQAKGGLADALEGEATLSSPMPGRVVSLKATIGQEVKLGDGIVVVEAMKMENELHSPKDGKIKSIAVKIGDAVEAGQDLITIE